MKKTILICSATLLLISLTACGDGNNKQPKSDNDVNP